MLFPNKDLTSVVLDHQGRFIIKYSVCELVLFCFKQLYYPGYQKDSDLDDCSDYETDTFRHRRAYTLNCK